MSSFHAEGRWAAVSGWGESHFDVVERDELRGLEIPRSQVQSWVKTKRLHPMYAKVWAVGRAAVRPEGHWRAAVLSCPETTLLSHVSAGLADGLAVPPAVGVHITTTSGARSLGDRVVHEAQILDPRDMTTRFAIPCTTTERTLVDLSDVLTYAELRHVFDKLRRFDPVKLDAARRRAGPRPGGPQLRDLLERGEPHTRSELERRYLRFAARHGIRRPDRVNAREGSYEVDFIYVDERLALELDGRAFHTRGDAVRRDHERSARLHLAGFFTHRIVWEQLNPHEEVATAALLRELLALRVK